jgi:hypothetical protein
MTEKSDGGIPNFESGKILLSTGDLQVLKVDLTSKRIDVDIADKVFIKRAIAMRNELAPKPPSTGEAESPSISGPLSMARSVADALSRQDITLTVSYKGSRIATIGAQAHPTLLQHITKTRGIALNSLYAAIKMLL